MAQARLTPDEAVEIIRQNGGITCDRNFVPAAEGWAVAVADTTLLVETKNLTGNDLKSYVASVQSEHWGAWIPSQQPEQTYLDDVTLVFDRDEAIKVGLANNQIAIYNLATGETIDLTSYKKSHQSTPLSFEEQVERAKAWARGAKAALAYLAGKKEDEQSDDDPERLFAWSEPTPVFASLIRLGASVQENALATLTDLLGDPTAADHKPARADIQKYKNAYDLYHAGRMKEDETERSSIGPGAIAAQEWHDKYGLNETEKRIVSEYQRSYQVLDQDPQKAFTQTIRKLRADSTLGLQSLDERELKKLIGGALKKYEQQNYPMLYEAISNALNDAYRRGPYESYKMWPRMVQWIKDRFEFFLWTENTSFNPRNQSWTKLDVVPHLVDIATEGGAILSQLRAENKLPQNFDVNQLSAGDFEKWLMDWKKKNRESEAAGQVVYEFKDGYTIQKLTSPESLQFEGDEMGHCVGSYSHQVADGSTIIYSLRDKKGMPHVTMEVVAIEGDYDGENPESMYIHPDRRLPHEEEHLQEGGSDKTFEVVQVQGNSNETPKPEYQRKIREFLDALRAHGWKFVRSQDWYPNHDDYDRNEPFYIGDSEGANDGWYNRDKNLAKGLDAWYDDYYLPQHEHFQGKDENTDAYGMPQRSQGIEVGDWDSLFQSALVALVETYNPDHWTTHDWAGLAQKVYHAWVLDYFGTKPNLSKVTIERGTQALRDEIQKADEKLMEWSDEQFDQFYEYNSDEIAQKIEELAQKEGRLDEIHRALEAEHGELGWSTYDLINYIQENDEDFYHEATDKIRDEIYDSYAGNAQKFIQYLIFLVEKQGLVGTGDLPNPNDRHGGLPSYEDLEKMPWPSEIQQQEAPVEKGLPGTLSKVATDGPRYYHSTSSLLSPGEIVYPASEYQEWHDSDKPFEQTWPDAHHYDPTKVYIWTKDVGIDDPGQWGRRVYEVEPLGSVERDPEGQFATPDDAYMYTGSFVTPRARVIREIKDGDWNQVFSKISSDEIQIHPIDQEHNTWLNEDGNEVRRWRPGWVKNPETGKMEQTGELEDSFLDNKGRQGNGYVAYHGDRPVGSLTYVEDPAGWIMLGTAYTHPDYRQQGIFNRLAQPLRDSGKPIDAYVWNNPWLKNKVRDWQMPKEGRLQMKKQATGEVMYHISAPFNRDSILAHGLNWELADPKSLLPNMDDPENHPEGWPRGQYLFRDYEEADMDAEDDIWEVNIEGLNVQPDAYLGKGNTHAVYVAEPIPPDRLRLVRPGAYEGGGWWESNV